MIDAFLKTVEINFAELPKTPKGAGIALYNMGFTVVPVKLVKDGPNHYRKVPMVEWGEIVEHGQEKEDVLSYYWNVDGVAIFMGVKLRNTSYYVGALDFDNKEAFKEALPLLPPTYTERTPRGGFHAIYLTKKKPIYKQYRRPGQRGEIFSVLGETENGKPKLCVIYPTILYKVIRPFPLRVIGDLNKLAEKVAEKLGLVQPELPKVPKAIPLTLPRSLSAKMNQALIRQRRQRVNPAELFEKEIKPLLDIARESSNYYAVHCPFHPPDAHPSFAVYKNTWLAVDFHDMKVYTMKELLHALRRLEVVKSVEGAENG